MRGDRDGAHHGGAYELRGFRQQRVLDLGDGEAGVPDGIERGSVAVTAHDEPVEPVHPVLQVGRAGVVGTQMLDEQELAAGP